MSTLKKKCPFFSNLKCGLHSAILFLVFHILYLAKKTIILYLLILLMVDKRQIFLLGFSLYCQSQFDKQFFQAPAYNFHKKNHRIIEIKVILILYLQTCKEAYKTQSLWASRIHMKWLKNLTSEYVHDKDYTSHVRF